MTRSIHGVVGLLLAVGIVACSGGGSSKSDGSGGSAAGAGGQGTGGVAGMGGRLVEIAGQGGAATAGAGGASGGATAGDGGSVAGSGGAASGGAAGGGPAGAGGAATGGGGAAGKATNGGSGGEGASGGGASSGGRGGSAGAGGGTLSSCAFSVNHTRSPAISTVEIVTWTVDLPNLTEAHLDFGPSGAAPTMTAPVDLGDPSHRTLLLGMKAGKPYTFRVVVRAGTTTCMSTDVSFTTGPLPGTAPKITASTGSGGAKGFIVTTTGLDGKGEYVDQPNAFIFDTDGDVVWWSSKTLKDSQGISRAHMSWDGKQMWIMGTTAGVVSTPMDGSTTEAHPELKSADHDLTVLPDGGIATVFRSTTATSKFSFVERKADGTVVTVVPDLATIYKSPSTFHPNAVHYYASDDSYTLSDRDPNLFVKLKRNGELVWQLGGANPVGRSLTLVGLTPWSVNHGHHLTPDGHFLFFNNGTGIGSDLIVDLALDEANGTATQTWTYHNGSVATYFGDAERLPNGNVLATYSVAMRICEVSPAGTIVKTWSGGPFGYADFRTSLYGPPPR